MTQGKGSCCVGSAEQASVAVFGLAVMGSNLARNIESRGTPVVVYNRTSEVTEKFLSEFSQKGAQFCGAYSLEELVEKLRPPRKIIIMIKAGKAVDSVLNELLPLLSPGDVILDGGNAYYRDTQARVERCQEMGIHFLGVGISGGEEGALRGPSLMPGGNRDAWQLVAPLLNSISATTKSGEKCTDYVGPDGSGHFVKMVHNGIEYADMQLIAEVYHVMRDGLKLSNDTCSQWFESWNQGRLASFLIEITSRIFQKRDDHGEGDLVDKILDKAGQKGTGKWTAQESLEFGVPIPTIAASVDARALSSMKEERMKAAREFSDRGLLSQSLTLTKDGTAQGDLEHALYAGKVVAYAQGMALIQRASSEFGWNVELDKIAGLWRAGCIIRADMLQDIMSAFRADQNLPNLIVSSLFKENLKIALPSLRRVVVAGVESGIPLPCLSASLSYLDSYLSANLPQNLIQAQRDYFGAHTYERNDREGVFHSKWEE